MMGGGEKELYTKRDSIMWAGLCCATLLYVKKYIARIVLIAFVIGAPVFAYACSCAAEYTREQAFEDAEAVFVGSVLSVKERGNTLKRLFGDGPTPSYRAVTFHVTERWKGTKENLITIATGMGHGDCGFHFAEGERYLVYARQAGDFYGKELATGICSHTEVLRHAGDDIAALGPGDSLFSDDELIYDPTNDRNTQWLTWQMLSRPANAIRSMYDFVLNGPWHISFGIIALVLVYRLVTRRKKRQHKK